MNDLLPYKIYHEILKEYFAACTNSCSPDGDHDGESINPDWMEPDLSGQIKEFFNTFDRRIKLVEERKAAVKKAGGHSDSMSSTFQHKTVPPSSKMSRSPSGEYITAWNSLSDLEPNFQRKCENILCLDGGGIRGLVLLLCLNELQKHLDKLVRFWVPIGFLRFWLISVMDSCLNGIF